MLDRANTFKVIVGQIEDDEDALGVQSWSHNCKTIVADSVVGYVELGDHFVLDQKVAQLATSINSDAVPVQPIVVGDVED